MSNFSAISKKAGTSYIRRDDDNDDVRF